MICAGAEAGTNSSCSLAGLRASLSNHLAQPRFASASWGVQVVSLETGVVVFEHDPGKLRIPASNTKLFTAAFLLDRFGPHARIRTSVCAEKPADSRGHLKGNLFILGRGDPSFAARYNAGKYDAAFLKLAGAIQKAGITRVEGDLVMDESFFRGSVLPTGCEWVDLVYGFAAPITALGADDNALELRIAPANRAGQPCLLTVTPEDGGLTFSNRAFTTPMGGARSIQVRRPPGSMMVEVSGNLPESGEPWTESLSVPDPSLRFGIRLRDALARLGIRVWGGVRVVGTEGAATGRRGPLVELAFVESETMRVMVRDVLKDSRNVTTDLLLRHAGATAQATNTSLAGLSSEAAGLRCLTNFCAARAGIPCGMVQLESGTGLSLNNRVSASAIVSLLACMSTHLSGDAFSNALPVAGVDGTLVSRMTGTRAEGRVSAKTGTLRRGVSLSGYVASAADESLAFAILLNDFDEIPEEPIRNDLDHIAVLLASLGERTSQPIQPQSGVGK